MKKIFRYMLVAVLGAFILCAATNSVQAADTHGINVDYYKSQNAVPNALKGKTPADKAKAAEAQAQSVSPNPNPPGSSSAYGGWGGTGVTGSSSSSSSSSSSASGGSSDDGKIFDILQRKIYNTLVDLRKIVYMISGFGLVAFAVAAIFNKISYKHLGYIMISLCLLALMFPFLEYFSGYKLESEEQKQLTFRNFLAASDYSRIRGELDADVMNGTGERPGEPGTHEVAALSEDQLQSMMSGLPEDPKIKVPTQIDSAFYNADAEKKAAFAKAGCNAASVSADGLSTKSAWDTKTGSRTVCVMGKNGKIQKTTETCQGKLDKNGVCKSTGWQKVQSLTKTTQNAIAVTTAGIASVGNAASMINNAQTGADALGDIARGDGTWYDKLNDMSNVTTNTFGSNGKATRDAMDILKNYTESNIALGNIGTEVNRNYENNPTGQNKFTEGRRDKNKKADKNIGGTIGGIGDNINKGASTGRTVHSQATSVNANIDNAKKTADAWKNLFK